MQRLAPFEGRSRCGVPRGMEASEGAMLRGVPFRVSTDEFEDLVRLVIGSIAAPLRARMNTDNLMIVIQSEVGETGSDSELDERVLGFYEGDNESVFNAYEYPKRIVLLQRHIENVCMTKAELVEQVADTVLH